MSRIRSLGLLAATCLALPAAATTLIPGNLVVLTEGAGVGGGTYADNQAAPITLMQFSHNGTSSASYVNALVLPQTSSGANSAISGEYGSSSEGGLELTADGKHLVLMGYGVNAADFNADPTKYGTAVNDPSKQTALGQSGSLTANNQTPGSTYTPVSRVVAVVGADGSVDTTTQLYNVFNGNNPRSVASKDGTSFYVSGQGVSGDNTGGVFYATKGATSATAITGLDTSSKTASQDTRMLGFGPDGQLNVSVDTKGGSNNARDFIGTLGTDPTSLYDSGNGPTQLNGYGTAASGKYKVNSATGNSLYTSSSKLQTNLSPESYFYADANTLYVADSGNSKNNSGSDTLQDDGGLQKWSLIGGVWTLDYTINAGLLNFVTNPNASSPANTSGTTGLFGLTGQVMPDGTVELFATNATIGDTDQTYLYGITDVLTNKTKDSNESFTKLATAPADSNFKGVAFAPSAIAAAAVPEPATYASMILGFAFAGGAIRRRQRAARKASMA